MHLETLTFPVINFVLYLLLLRWVYKKYLAAGLKARSASIAQLINKAAVDLADAERELGLLQAQLDEVTSDRETRIEEFKREGDRIAQSVLAEAKADAERTLREANLQAEGFKDQVEKEIRLEIAEGAIRRARERFAQEFSDKQDEQLRKEVLGAVL